MTAGEGLGERSGRAWTSEVKQRCRCNNKAGLRALSRRRSQAVVLLPTLDAQRCGRVGLCLEESWLGELSSARREMPDRRKSCLDGSRQLDVAARWPAAILAGIWVRGAAEVWREIAFVSGLSLTLRSAAAKDLSQIDDAPQLPANLFYLLSLLQAVCRVQAVLCLEYLSLGRHLQRPGTGRMSRIAIGSRSWFFSIFSLRFNRGLHQPGGVGSARLRSTLFSFFCRVMNARGSALSKPALVPARRHSVGPSNDSSQKCQLSKVLVAPLLPGLVLRSTRASIPTVSPFKLVIKLSRSELAGNRNLRLAISGNPRSHTRSSFGFGVEFCLQHETATAIFDFVLICTILRSDCPNTPSRLTAATEHLFRSIDDFELRTLFLDLWPFALLSPYQLQTYPSSPLLRSESSSEVPS